MNTKLLELDFRKDIIEPINNKQYKTSELADVLGVSVKDLKQYIKDYGFKWMGSQYYQDGTPADYIVEYNNKKDDKVELDKKKLLKKDMIVDLDNYTIDIPDIGKLDIQIIYDAYERIQQRIGIENAREVGIHLGRPKEDVPEEFIHYYNLVESKSMSVVDAVAQMGIARTSYYRYKNKYEESCK